jgi:hypothetical protein
MNKSLILKSAIALALAAPMLASAESDLTVGAGPAAVSAAARLNFQVIIPKVLYLAVGTGNATLADSDIVDNVIFDYSGNAAAVGTGAAAGAITGSAVSVRVLGNNGPIAIGAVGTGTGLVSSLDSADIIPWTEILAESTLPEFAAPAVGGSASLTPNAGKVTNRTATWNFAYLNTNIAAPGTYTGQVTYTATMP